jgi:cell division inhibitor SulA/protein ImuA
LPPGLVWQADRIARPSAEALPTGFAALDAQLPGGGWPRGALIELLTEHPGIGEIELLLPLLRSAPAERWIAWIAPPLMPYAPALAASGMALDQFLLTTPSTHAETLWATRQALISGACAMVLAWPSRIDSAALRRLQLAAEESLTPLFLFRPVSAANQSSPATLRLRLAAEGNALAVHILKRRGPALAAPVYLPVARRSGRSPDHLSSDLHALVRPDSSRLAATSIHARRG